MNVHEKINIKSKMFAAQIAGKTLRPLLIKHKYDKEKAVLEFGKTAIRMIKEQKESGKSMIESVLSTINKLT